MLLHLRARVRAAAARPEAGCLPPLTTPSTSSPPSRRALALPPSSSSTPLATASPLSSFSSRRGPPPARATAAAAAARPPSSSSRRARPRGGGAAARAAPDSSSSSAAATTTNTTTTDTTDAEEYELVLQVAQSISAVPADEWDAVAVAAAGGAQSANPFVSHAFLRALEESGSAVPRAGWAPQHLLVRLRSRRSSSSSSSSSSPSSSSPGGGVLVGCAPVYLKGHSAGEYVFDHSWAEFHEARGGSYYPKLVCCVPFTPVEGPRLMAGGPALEPVARQLLAASSSRAAAAIATIDDARREAAAAVRRALISGLRELADEYGCSGAHVNFCTAEEQAALGEALFDNGSGGSGAGDTPQQQQAAASLAASRAFLPRFGWQYHWENRGYATFADFEADLRQSRRKSVRQERKAVAKQGLHLKRRRGDELSAGEWDHFHDFYLDTVDRRWGRAYLTRDFFARLGGEPELAQKVLMVTAHEGVGVGGEASPLSSSSSSSSSSPSTLVAGALNLQGGDALYGRNWGAAPGRADAHPFLHFALCYYEAIDHAVERGLARVEAGAQGEHKLQRGYLPALTRSAHLIRAADPPGASLKVAVARFLRGEAREVAETWQRLSLEASPFKGGTTAELVARRANEYLSAGGAASVPFDVALAAAAASVSSVDA